MCGVVSLLSSWLDRWHLCWIFGNWTGGPLRIYFSVNTIVDILLAWQGTPHLGRNIVCYLNEHFHDQWISYGDMQNRPSWSLDLRPLDYHVWGYMKNVMYECKEDTGEELLQKFFLMQDALVTLQFFICLHIIWSNESWCASKLVAAISVQCNPSSHFVWRTMLYNRITCTYQAILQTTIPP
jgi:hypothetical protein